MEEEAAVCEATCLVAKRVLRSVKPRALSVRSIRCSMRPELRGRYGEIVS